MPSGEDRTVVVVDRGGAPSSVAAAPVPPVLRAVPAFLFSPPSPPTRVQRVRCGHEVAAWCSGRAPVWSRLGFYSWLLAMASAERR
jgi:hypothetical protein